jgi:hypothetical protein
VRCNIGVRDPSRHRRDSCTANEETIERLIRPDALTKDEPLIWSAGRGVDLWAMFVAAVTGDVQAIVRLLDKAQSLVARLHGVGSWQHLLPDDAV